MHRFALQWLLAAGVPLAVLPAQDPQPLKERVLAALHGQNAPPGRPFILRRRPAESEPAKDQPANAGSVPVFDCPLCKQHLAQVPLWKGQPGIDDQPVFTAHVCEQHELFFVTDIGTMHGTESGPFALPAARTKPVRPFLPYGAVPVDAPEAWPRPRWASADGALFHADGDGGRFEVRNTDRTVYREARADVSGMGILAWDIAGDAGLVAYARSASPLIVGELGTSRQRARVPLQNDNVSSIAIHPDGTLVAFVVDEGLAQQQSFRLLDLASGRIRVLARAPAVPHYFTFLPGQDRLIASTHDGTVSAWTITTGRQEWQATVDAGICTHRVFSRSPDARRLLAISRGGLLASLLDTRTGAVEGRFAVRQPDALDRDSGECAVAWSADSRQFVWAAPDGRLGRGDVAAPWRLHRHFGACELVSARLGFAPDGNGVLSRDAKGNCLRWPLGSFDAPE